jgi:hypothetical protein
MNSHSVRTVGLIVIVFAVAGLQALHGLPALTQHSGAIDMVAAMLLTVEHLMQGNTQ